MLLTRLDDGAKSALVNYDGGFETFLEDFWGQLGARAATAGENLGNRMVAPLDLIETESEYIIQIDAPGLKRDQIQIEARDALLTVAGKREIESAQSEAPGKALRRERVGGSFRREFRLKDLDPDRIEADYTDGELKIVAAKRASAQARRIELK